jgi:predicted DNA-binding transcriptional regulator AlpA
MLREVKESEVSIRMNSRFLTEFEVSERTQISLATLRRWRLENRGPKYHKFGSLVRYGEEELTRWEQVQPSGGEDATERIKPRSVRSSVLIRKSG